jgi:hypothetical protein
LWVLTEKLEPRGADESSGYSNCPSLILRKYATFSWIFMRMLHFAGSLHLRFVAGGFASPSQQLKSALLEEQQNVAHGKDVDTLLLHC